MSSPYHTLPVGSLWQVDTISSSKHFLSWWLDTTGSWCPSLLATPPGGWLLVFFADSSFWPTMDVPSLHPQTLLYTPALDHPSQYHGLNSIHIVTSPNLSLWFLPCSWTPGIWTQTVKYWYFHLTACWHLSFNMWNIEAMVSFAYTSIPNCPHLRIRCLHPSSSSYLLRDA